ncbi:phage baseplate assembly protein W [Pseudomonas fluorescens]|uniref:GPW/gp25 family protein n=1 Tax=Pseudomonas fluorescens TaxID=294 RepID=UPI00209ED539|nr:GPW/gp25 family protein [Pseudomonas fluorescens]MCP1489809.1 phage baseplate assembly protein W [Pseudomonas fluorescens]
MNNKASGIYGRGWAFPPAFTIPLTPQQGVTMVEDQEDIQQSLQILFNTATGERLMRPDYGCDLNSVMFENLCDDLLASIERKITESILRYETRVALTSLQVTQNQDNPSQLDVLITYRVRGSNTTGQLNALLDLADGLGVSFP